MRDAIRGCDVDGAEISCTQAVFVGDFQLAYFLTGVLDRAVGVV